jgi:hypothetical protein
VSGWTLGFLGAIAVATVLMAAIQVGAVIYASRLARKVQRISEQVEAEIKPLFTTLNQISVDAARAASLAAAQVERADRLFADVSLRVEQTVTALQNSIVAPARQGVALINGIRAALAALRAFRNHARARSRSEDEDALFIG